MSEEELKRVKGIIKRLYAGTGVTVGDIVDTAPWLDKLVNEVDKLQKENKEYIDIFNSTEKIMNRQERTKDKLLKENVELQKENEELKEELEKANKQMDLDYVDNNFISKDIIRNKIKELEKIKHIEEIENKSEFGIQSDTWGIADWGIGILKELLGE